MITTIKDSSEKTLQEISEEMELRKTNELFLLFPLGSQTDHLIAQHIAKQRVFCLPVDPNKITAEDVLKLKPKGIFLSGSPASVYDGTVTFDKNIFTLGIPVLGICYGAQLIADHIGLTVEQAQLREYGTHAFEVSELGKISPLLKNIPHKFNVIQNHGDHILAGDNITVLGYTENSIAAFAHKTSFLYGVQFHPEVSDTEYGDTIFKNFISFICNAKKRFPVVDVAEEKINALAKQINGKTVVIALSGGSDSSVCAYLLYEASKRCPDGVKIYALYIKGVDRPEDEAYVRKYFGDKEWLSLNVVDAREDFLTVLTGKGESKLKRAAFRQPYQQRIEDEIFRVGADFIVQGTLYTDISESGGGYEGEKSKAQIKQHHNVNLKFSVPEIMPLSDLVKDNARDVGRKIGVPEVLLTRHPFPGPGNAIRILGEITEERLRIVTESDRILIEELRNSNQYEMVWQAGAIATNSKSTYQLGDTAGTAWVVAFFAVNSVNGFTAQFTRLPWEVIDRISKRIQNEVRGVARVVYNVSDKPGATIEWE